MSLFPGKSGFTATVNNFGGSYDLNAGALSLTADDVKVSIGQVLAADATGLSIAYDPTASPALTVSSKTIDLTSPDFPGLDATATDFTASSAGFSLGSATLSDSSPITLGGLLELDGLQVTATGLSYQTNPPSGQPALQGTIGISTDAVKLFHGGNSAFTTTIDKFSGSYDLQTSVLTLQAGESRHHGRHRDDGHRDRRLLQPPA